MQPLRNALNSVCNFMQSSMIILYLIFLHFLCLFCPYPPKTKKYPQRKRPFKTSYKIHDPYLKKPVVVCYPVSKKHSIDLKEIHSQWCTWVAVIAWMASFHWTPLFIYLFFLLFLGGRAMKRTKIRFMPVCACVCIHMTGKGSTLGQLSQISNDI